MLKLYRAPDGTTWQYEEGLQPTGYAEADGADASKARKSVNKVRDGLRKSRPTQGARSR